MFYIYYYCKIIITHLLIFKPQNQALHIKHLRLIATNIIVIITNVYFNKLK